MFVHSTYVTMLVYERLTKGYIILPGMAEVAKSIRFRFGLSLPYRWQDPRP